VHMKNQSFHRIKNIKVTGGFLMGVDLSFHDGLNCVIGPRGTGKSSIQEMIRYALDMLQGREGDPIRKRIQSLVENNLNGGRVALGIETKEGLTYTVSRAAGEDPILLDENENPLPATPLLSQMFRADIYSQNQIESIAETPHYQLDLIDKFVEEKLGFIRAQSAETLRKLASNAALISPLLTEKSQLECDLTQLEGVLEKLKSFAKSEGPDAESLNRGHNLKALRDREMRAVDHSKKTLADFRSKLETFIGYYGPQATDHFAQDMIAGPNGQAISALIKGIQGAVQNAEGQIAVAIAHIAKAEEQQSKARQALEQAHAGQEMEFRKQLELQKQNQAQSAERTKYEKQRNDLLFKQRRLKDVIKQIGLHIKEREKLLATLSEDRDRRNEVRSEVASRLNDSLMPHIRVRIDQNADQAAFRAFLESNIRGPVRYFNSVAAAIASTMSPQELGALIRNGDSGNIAKKAGISPQSAFSVLKAFSSPEILMDLETVDMDDSPAIELCDNGVYKNSAELSTGQKCTAILPILMFDSINPLLIDQPEDNLDNRYVYETVVASINQVKTSRQLIFVTHNPNIPVLSDASQVIVMQSDGQTAKPRHIGNVDECRNDIISVLEGGEEAFRLRSERYNGHNE